MPQFVKVCFLSAASYWKIKISGVSEFHSSDVASNYIQNLTESWHFKGKENSHEERL